MRAALVLTTIADPALLDLYASNFEEYGHLDRVSVFVIPDCKTPPEAAARCERQRARGLKVACPSIEEQEAFLASIGLPPGFVPYNSDNRRNVGYLMALESGAGMVVSIDDDNLCRAGEDFLSGHSIVCEPDVEQTIVDSSTGYLNACSLLQFDRNAPVYPRGFPYCARHLPEQVTFSHAPVPVHINAGLWLGDPDLDGITWLVSGAKARYFRGPSLVLGPSTWSPVNSQNTALRREAVPSYYFIRMGYSIGGLEIDRFGDIFSGYFAEACAKHLGGCVRIGSPVADHVRNSHDYFKDAAREWSCIQLLEDLIPWLREVRLSGSTYLETYRSLAAAIEAAVDGFSGPVWTGSSRAFFRQMAFHMRLWANACETILA